MLPDAAYECIQRASVLSLVPNLALSSRELHKLLLDQLISQGMQVLSHILKTLVGSNTPAPLEALDQLLQHTVGRERGQFYHPAQLNLLPHRFESDIASKSDTVFESDTASKSEIASDENLSVQDSLPVPCVALLETPEEGSFSGATVSAMHCVLQVPAEGLQPGKELTAGVRGGCGWQLLQLLPCLQAEEGRQHPMRGTSLAQLMCLLAY